MGMTTVNDPQLVAYSVDALLAPPEDWFDTPEQAQLRVCLKTALMGHSPTDTIRICHQLITLMRDQLMTGAGQIRRQAARQARQEGLTVTEIAAASGQTVQTIARLITESRSM